MRINILYMLDNLCEASLTHQIQAPTPSQPSTSAVPSAPQSYAQYVTRDLSKIVDLVVPEARGGLVNLMSTRQVHICQTFLTIFLPDDFSRADSRQLAYEAYIGASNRR